MKKYKLLPARYYLVLTLIIITFFWVIRFASAVAAPLQQGQDIAVITSPTSNAVIRGVVPIIGSADYPTFSFYIIEVSPEPVTGNQWQIIGETHQTSVLNGQLETWNTTLVPDGSYTLRLRVVRFDGNYSEFFVQQVVVSNTQPIPTDTPTAVLETPTPTITPTDLPPTPTVAIEQPIVETPTPRPVETTAPLADPAERNSLIPSVSGFSMAPLKDACLYGAGIMLSIFLFFGFLAALRNFIVGLIQQWQGRSK
jgi:hypothetical protein